MHIRTHAHTTRTQLNIYVDGMHAYRNRQRTVLHTSNYTHASRAKMCGDYMGGLYVWAMYGACVWGHTFILGAHVCLGLLGFGRPHLLLHSSRTMVLGTETEKTRAEATSAHCTGTRMV